MQPRTHKTPAGTDLGRTRTNSAHFAESGNRRANLSTTEQQRSRAKQLTVEPNDWQGLNESGFYGFGDTEGLGTLHPEPQATTSSSFIQVAVECHTLGAAFAPVGGATLSLLAARNPKP